LECCSILSYFFHFIRKSLPDNISTSTPTTTNNVTRKKSSRKPSKNVQQQQHQQTNVNTSYEHHLEKWLENASKMNFDYSNLDGNWSIMNSSSPSNAFQSANRKSHLPQYGSAEPISLPPHIVSCKLWKLLLLLFHSYCRISFK
jgi:hypothetical protein